MNYIVDRNTWVRGGNAELYGNAELLNSLGNHCCLGFCLIQEGFKDEDILGYGEPADLIINKKIYNPLFHTIIPEEEDDEYISLNSTLSDRAIVINDNDKIDDVEREKQLQELFKENNHTIEFI